MDSPLLHLVHPAGGSVLCYRQLAGALAPEIAVGAFQAPALEGDRPFTDVAAAADRYLAELSDGPVFLGGWSCGGVIAFEMARRLAAAGHRVGPLVLVDVTPPTGDVPAEPALVTGFDRDLRRLMGTAHGLRADERATRLAIFQATVRATAAYRPPGPFHGDVLVLSGRTTDPGQEWRPPATGRVIVRRFPTDHYGLMEPPHVGAIANFIKSWKAL